MDMCACAYRYREMNVFVWMCMDVYLKIVNWWMCICISTYTISSDEF